ncbi:Cobyrinic acid ac-diamide synthase [Methanocaldococcus vulcanius M7]|uniref:Cobyrinic acid ac-diamide synthase n=1 Tax=Methanocaldococcus vulcanius (strain ATCC 700851 / DSM 12094 / M7) TaxID=579137 RepID=C9RFQ4_METVM|nr:P-loop NTPase [Methanocaldococcus vulcanius]ACX72406.1 Cobyrinic acid ac-diamide synthase [Methanocaldococcus vulcanius M7]
MKISICGKGGCGKSSITALISKELANRGYKVLVIDGDESNLSLHRLLGVDLPKDFIEYLGGRKKFMEKVRKKALGRKVKLFDEDISINSLPKEYVSEKGNIKFLAVGKIHDFGEGCACPMGALLREFLNALKLNDGEVVVVDTEAGIEHFGRGVESGCDVIVGIIDPTYESINLSKKIEEIGEKLGKKVYFIINKADDNTKDLILKNVSRDKVIAVIPQREEIMKCGLLGEEMDIDVPEIKEIVDKLLK